MDTIRPCSSDIRGLNIYASGISSWQPTVVNISAYISATPVWTNGTLCAQNLALTKYDAIPNFIACPGISNAAFVTIMRNTMPGAGGNQISAYEVQVLRSGEAQLHNAMLLNSMAGAVPSACQSR